MLPWDTATRGPAVLPMANTEILGKVVMVDLLMINPGYGKPDLVAVIQLQSRPYNVTTAALMQTANYKGPSRPLATHIYTYKHVYKHVYPYTRAQ